MEDVRKLTEIVKNARERYANVVELLADEYVERFAYRLKENFKKNPENSEVNFFTLAIGGIDFGKCQLDTVDGIDIYEGNDILLLPFVKVFEREWLFFEKNHFEAGHIKLFIEALEKRGFVVCASPVEHEPYLYPFLKV